MEESVINSNKGKVLIKYFTKTFLVGLLVLVVFWGVLIKVYDFDFSWSGLTDMHRANNLLYAMDLFPLLLAGVATYLGRNAYLKISSLDKTLKGQSENVSKVAAFAEKIGKGEFQYEFTPFGEEDVLGKALIEMRNSLVQSSKNEEERSWIITSMAEVSEILRSNNELKKLSEEAIAFLTKKINAVQGAFYIVNDENPDDVFIEMVGSYAYNKKKYLQGKFKFGQGLVGQACIERDIVFRTEIPDDYVTVTSGLLGDRKPKSILIVPVITNEKVFGAVEFAGFEKFTSLHIKLIQELGDIIARTIFNVKVNENTNRLFQEIKKSQERTQVLLENASEIINIYDKDGNIKYVSPSVKNILGTEPEQLVGKSEFDRVHPKGRESVQRIFEQLNANPKLPVTSQYTYMKPDGSRIWVETTGRNLLDNPAIGGILFNTIDITERRKAEKEQRERAKMQALSENSPDIILRFDLQKKISYINPTVEKYTGFEAGKFLLQYIDDVPLDKIVTEKWHEFIDRIVAENTALADEMEFVNVDGQKLFMEVNAMPEAGQDGNLESILMVLHNITEAKLAELKIKEANQKVQDSINYAKRIQNSILPKEIVLQDAFKESFMLFMPKDVVSGDFPFIVQKGDYVYFAAVDCTGHGVPGALLSVIGSLILNEIIRYETPTPSVMLDHLHSSVVKTLRQGEVGGENERDGMDVGMCRVNIKTGEFMFSGAHRPLYIVRHDQKPDEELEEVKGDKYPIGGVQYRGREKFTNFETKLTKGDRVYVCSDGYPDQFGGPDPKELKKIGPKKIRKILVDNKDKSIQEVHAALLNNFEEWKGYHKQMDDVLFIGIDYSGNI
ncbi:MAG: PAS domain S-box protein [Flavobacteriales bacterium]